MSVVPGLSPARISGISVQHVPQRLRVKEAVSAHSQALPASCHGRQSSL